MLDTFGQTDKSKGNVGLEARVKRLEEDIRDRDRKNIELHNELKSIIEENKTLKDDNDRKSKQLSNKIIELKREHDKY